MYCLLVNWWCPYACLYPIPGCSLNLYIRQYQYWPSLLSKFQVHHAQRFIDVQINSYSSAYSLGVAWKSYEQRPREGKWFAQCNTDNQDMDPSGSAWLRRHPISISTHSPQKLTTFYVFLVYNYLSPRNECEMWERTQHWPREHSRWAAILSLFINKTPFSPSCPKEWQFETTPARFLESSLKWLFLHLSTFPHPLQWDRPRSWYSLGWKSSCSRTLADGPV